MDSIIRDNLALVKEKIARAEMAAGLASGAVRLVGVTKNRTVPEIEEAISEGLSDIGENRFQEAAQKLPQIGQPVTRHFVGHLQEQGQTGAGAVRPDPVCRFRKVGARSR